MQFKSIMYFLARVINNYCQDDIDKMVSKLEEKIQNLEEGSCMDALVLPLHGSLPPELQVVHFDIISFSLYVLRMAS